MIARINEVDYTLATNGISTTSSSDGANGLSLTIVTDVSLDSLKEAFNGVEEVTILDDAGTVTQTYEDYVVLKTLTANILDETVTVSMYQRTYAELIKLLNVSQELQNEAIDTLIMG